MPDPNPTENPLPPPTPAETPPDTLECGQCGATLPSFGILDEHFVLCSSCHQQNLKELLEL